MTKTTKKVNTRKKWEDLLYELSGGADDYGRCMVDVEKAIPLIQQIIVQTEVKCGLNSFQVCREEVGKAVEDCKLKMAQSNEWWNRKCEKIKQGTVEEFTKKIDDWADDYCDSIDDGAWEALKLLIDKKNL